MANCKSCGKELEETFLGKIKGTIVKENKQGKNILHYFCDECQKSIKAKEFKKTGSIR